MPELTKREPLNTWRKRSPWSIVDAELAFLIHRLLLAGDPVWPKVEAWAREPWKRASVQAFVKKERTPA